LASAVDALIDNIFAYTDAGVPFIVTLRWCGDRAELVIADGGVGLPTNAAAANRSDRVSNGQGLVNSRR
jgi:signal transduction histidine kinase